MKLEQDKDFLGKMKKDPNPGKKIKGALMAGWDKDDWKKAYFLMDFNMQKQQYEYNKEINKLREENVKLHQTIHSMNS